jgi:DNA-binding Lrp family transcriptional regulator
MLKVFVLVNTSIGEAGSVAKSLRELPHVVSADATIGLYDVIVEAQVADPKELGKLVAFDVQCTPGVIETLTCLVMDV